MGSKIIIVDRYDQEIGVKERREIEHDDIYRVSGLWILNEKNEVLLARRAFSKSHDPGKWGTSVAGTVEEGEDYKSNIEKEAQEELGIFPTPLHTGQCDFINGEHKFFCQWFSTVVSSDTEFVIQEDEVAEIRWWLRKELMGKLASQPEEFISSMSKAVESIPNLG